MLGTAEPKHHFQNPLTGGGVPFGRRLFGMPKVSRAADRKAAGISASADAQTGSGHLSRGSQIARQSADRYRSAIFAPSSRNKKNDAPPHRLCDRCQAICDSAIRTRFFFMTLSSSQHGTPSMTRYTSGMPVPVRFSILFQWDFFGRYFLNDFQRFCSGWGMFDHFTFDKGRRVAFPNLGKPRDNLLAGQFVKLMGVVLFAPVDGQATKRRPDLFSVDRRRELARLFGPARQFIKPLQLTEEGDAVPALLFFAQFFDQFDNMWIVAAIQKQAGSLRRLSLGITSLSGALGIRVQTLDNISGKLALTVSQTSGTPSRSFGLFHAPSIVSVIIFKRLFPKIWLEGQTPCNQRNDGVTTTLLLHNGYRASVTPLRSLRCFCKIKNKNEKLWGTTYWPCFLLYIAGIVWECS